MSESTPVKTAGPAGRYGPFAVATVTMALVAFPIAFNLGAYDAVFYDDLFRFVVAATAGLAVSFLTPATAGGRLWGLRAALVLPALWLTLAVLVFESTAEAATDPVFGFLALLVALASIPAVLTLLIQLFVPELSTLENTRLVVASAVIVVVTVGAGYVIGVNNDAFLTCADFKVAGSDLPPNCSPG